MKRFLFYLIIMITFISFFKITVEAKSVSSKSTVSFVYSYAQGSGSGSGSGGSGGGGDCSGLFTSDALDLIDTILNYFRILAPVLLVVLVAVDFGSAVLSQDSDAMKRHKVKYLVE